MEIHNTTLWHLTVMYNTNKTKRLMPVGNLL